MDSKTNFKDQLNKVTKRLFNRHEGRFLKAAAAALLVTTLTYNFAFAKEDTTPLNLEQVFHVYNDTDYIGTVDSEKKVQAIIDEAQEAASTQYKELSVDVGSNIKVIPELVYNANTNTEETLASLSNELVVKAVAQEVTVNGETVAYLKDAKELDEVINKVKLQYVSQEQLDSVNARQLSNEELPELAVGETRILNISIAEELAVKEVTIDPTKIVSIEDAAKLLTSGALEKETYAVQQGDVLGSIATKFNLKLAELLQLNPGLAENSVLKIGQTLNVTALKPLINVQVVIEKKTSQPISFDTVKQNDANMLKGETKVLQEGQAGKKQTVYKLVDTNGVRTSGQITSDEVVAEPVNKIVAVGTKVIPSQGTGKFNWPTNGGYVSSKMGARWGSYHRGIDIARPSNYTIKAADNGKVTFVGWDGTYGRKVVINHNNGYETVYAHLSSFNVSVGQTVQTGTKIGVMGSTGRSTGVHLHFEVHKNGANVNPLSYLK